MQDANQQFRLRRFWGAAIFSLGTLWGFSNVIYFPVAALTSIVGSSWLEVGIIFAGGVLTFLASILAFYHRPIASRVLLSGGFFLLAVAIGWQVMFPLSTRGILNLLLLFLSGAVAIALGLFGIITERKGWPTLRDLP